MIHFIKNLVLLPFRLVWDVFLTLFVILLVINLFCWICATGIGVVILVAIFLTEPAMLLLPFCLLAYLKHPWPGCPQKIANPQKCLTNFSF